MPEKSLMAHNTKEVHESTEDKEVNLGIVITPMLDMAFQILAFFVITYHPSALEGHINGKLLPPEKIAVKSQGAPQKKAEAEKITDSEPDTKEALTIYVRAVGFSPEGQGVLERREGEPSGFLIKTMQMRDPERVVDLSDLSDPDLSKPFRNLPEGVTPKQELIRRGLKKLQDRLKKIRESASGESMVVRLHLDPNLKNAYVVGVWNVSRSAGFQNIGFVAPNTAGSK
jgi:biopolymer transport protein ExbD